MCSKSSQNLLRISSELAQNCVKISSKLSQILLRIYSKLASNNKRMEFYSAVNKGVVEEKNKGRKKGISLRENIYIYRL